MDKISLKVVVAGRSYPLSLNPGEEEKVNRAAEDINNAIQVLKENYAVKDMQDLLAMAALQLATKSSQSNSTITPTDYSSVEKALDDLAKEIGDL
jgi:cell division protein ZapA (FtsZ GTPase activity inhibitor)